MIKCLNGSLKLLKYISSPVYLCRQTSFLSTVSNPVHLKSFELNSDLETKYESLRNFYKNKISESQMPNPKGVFANNELHLADIDVYGFDYDYTLAVYKESLHELIYELARDRLVNVLKYPREIFGLNFVKDFAIRGLHYDIENGLLMKLDGFHQIQMKSVFRGLTAVPDEEVIEVYGGSYIPQSYIRGVNEFQRMKQLNDLFSVPEMCLLSNVAEYFIKNHISYHPEILFYDVQTAVQSIHPIMHTMLDETNISSYLEKQPELFRFLQRLKDAGKNLFLITNSPFKFVDVGMKYMMGEEWFDLFDLIIVHARKPKFFVQSRRPFRFYDHEKDCPLWTKVENLEKGKVYMQGTVSQLVEMTGWIGRNTLYFGDQIYSDLADLTLNHGWRTGAVITELEVVCRAAEE